MSSEHIQLRPLSTLSRWDRNYRVGDVPAIIASIVRFGFNGALKVWQDGSVMAGNHALISLETMRATGAKPPRGISIQDGDWMVPCIDVSHLSALEAQAYALADNRTQELGQNDPDRLAALLGELAGEPGGLEGTGYTEVDLKDLLRGLAAAQRKDLVDPGPQSPSDPDFGEIRPKEGEIWQCGEHRLLCGDATDKALVAQLFAGEQAHMIFTDPPYGVAYVGKTPESLTIANDDLGDTGTRLLVGDLMKAAPLRRGGAFYVCSPAGSLELQFRLGLDDAGLPLKQAIVWVKNTIVLGRSDYHYQHESILYGWKLGAGHYFIDDRTQSTTWHVPKPVVNKDHPTMKPLELVERAVGNSSKAGEIVYDCCSGSGTTLIACERLSRIFRGAELLPRYAEVILRRWEEVTGGQAHRSRP